jgi:hypothetical protein
MSDPVRPEYPELERLYNRLIEIACCDDEIEVLRHSIACKELGLDPKTTVVGGNEADFIENIAYGKWTLVESDPRFDRYWDIISMVMMRAHGNAIETGTRFWETKGPWEPGMQIPPAAPARPQSGRDVSRSRGDWERGDPHGD